MNFFLKIRDSIYSPQFYAKLPKQSFGSAFGYFFLLILLITVLHAVSIFAQWGGIRAPQQAVEKIISSAVNYFPDNLIVTIKDGQASSNVTEPYYVPLPQDQQAEAANLVVIDTKTPFSAAQFKQYNTIMWLSKDSLIVAGDQEIRVIDLSEVENMTVNKQLVLSIEDKIRPWLKIITPLVVVGLILGLYIFYMFRLVYLLLFALLIMLVSSIVKRPLSYGAAYKTGLHAMTLGLFVELLPLYSIPFLFTMITLVIVFLNLRVKQKTKK